MTSFGISDVETLCVNYVVSLAKIVHVEIIFSKMLNKEQAFPVV